MNTEFLRRIRALVSQELAALSGEGRAERIAELPVSHVGADPLDQAQAQTEQSLTLRFSDRKHRYILKLKEALSRMDLGLFGNCEECGGDIPMKRLLARPTAAHCVACKSELEGQERPRVRPRIAAFVPA